MTNKLIHLIFLLLLSTALFASPFHFGVEGTIGTAIGTGKGNWDWTDPALGIQRSAPLNLGAAFMILTDIGTVFQLEAGAGYYWNKSSVSNGDDTWTYKQESLEFPLGLRLFFNAEKRGLYAKGGTALIVLTGKSSYKNDDSAEELFDTQEAENKIHAGLQIGIGYQKEIKKILWELEAKYITFYSSPDYSRSDGSTADTRFHRMALNLGFFF